jgi:hypothetical protein
VDKAASKPGGPASEPAANLLASPPAGMASETLQVSQPAALSMTMPGSPGALPARAGVARSSQAVPAVGFGAPVLPSPDSFVSIVSTQLAFRPPTIVAATGGEASGHSSPAVPAAQGAGGAGTAAAGSANGGGFAAALAELLGLSFAMLFAMRIGLEVAKPLSMAYDTVLSPD